MNVESLKNQNLGRKAASRAICACHGVIQKMATLCIMRTKDVFVELELFRHRQHYSSHFPLRRDVKASSSAQLLNFPIFLASKTFSAFYFYFTVY